MDTESFISVTGANPEVANFFLEAAKGDVEQAINNYFASDGRIQIEGNQSVTANISESQEQDAAPRPISTVAPPVAASRQRGPIISTLSEAKKASAGRGAGGRPVHGMSDVRRQRFMDDDDDEENDEGDNEQNDYYAGGEKSGQLVRGGKNKENVDNLFQTAMQHGAQQGTREDLNPRTRSFIGTARTLGGSERKVEDTSEPRRYTIVFYANDVFTVNDGEPRSMVDPTNMEFLSNITKGQVPKELEAPDQRPVDVNLIRKEVPYTEAEKPKYRAFQGTGRTLAGNDEPATTSDPAGSSMLDPTTEIQAAWEGPDSSQPATSLQIRLQDGTRVVGKFNHTHAIGDVRRFLRSVRPDIVEPYQLMTSYPPTPLTDNSQSLEAAGLLNAVVIQKK